MSIDAFGPCFRRVTCAFALSTLVALPVVSVAEEQPISEAETTLFQIDHFKHVIGSKVLKYEFQKKGTLEPPLTGTVDLEVGPSQNGTGHSIVTRCAIGGQVIELDRFDNAVGNPVIVCFLERDLREMNRLTTAGRLKGGSTMFFRNRIRMALAESADVTPFAATFDGKSVTGKQIRIAPYIKTQERERENFKRFATKTYLFQVSDEIPGGILKISSTIPDEGTDGQPALVEETLVLTEVLSTENQK